MTRPLSASGPTSANEIIRIVADFTGVSVKEILGPDRSQRVAVPRLVAVHLVRKNMGYSYPQIGRIFNRDHTTVLAADHKIAAMVAAERQEQAL